MEDIDCQENRFLIIYLMLNKRLEWSIKKAMHLEKVACRKKPSCTRKFTFRSKDEKQKTCRDGNPTSLAC